MVEVVCPYADRADEGDKVEVVSHADAVVDERTVVVEPEYAVVAVRAVVRVRRAPD